MRTLKKTAHFRIAEFFEGEEAMQDSVLAGMLSDLEHIYAKDGQFSYTDELECIVVSYEESDGFQMLHLATFETGTDAAIISSVLRPNLPQITQHPAPKGNEYIKSQLFLLCKGKCISWVSHNSPLMAISVRGLLQRLFEALYFFLPPSESPKILLTTPVNQRVLEQLDQEDISHVELSTRGVRDLFEHSNKHGKIPASLINIFFEQDDLDGASDLVSKHILKPTKPFGKPKVKKVLEKISSALIDNTDDDEGFVIKTKRGHRITKNNLIVTHQINTEGDSHNINPDKTFNALKAVFGNMVKLADCNDMAEAVRPSDMLDFSEW